MTTYKHSLLAGLVALLVACSDRSTAPSAGPETALSTLEVSPITLKFKVSGNWKMLADVGDYVKKVAGDSVEYVVSSEAPVRVPGSAISTDVTGGTTYGLQDGVYTFLIDWADPIEGFFPVKNTGDYLKLVSTGIVWSFEVTSGAQFSQAAWTLDNAGNARFARCNTTPVCNLT